MDISSQQITITPQEVANRIHRQQGDTGDHSEAHSCGCMHLALYYLGIRDTTGLFWPDKTLKNQWKV